MLRRHPEAVHRGVLAKFRANETRCELDFERRDSSLQLPIASPGYQSKVREHHTAKKTLNSSLELSPPEAVANHGATERGE